MPSLAKLFKNGHSKSDSVSAVSRPESIQPSTTPTPSYKPDKETFDQENIIEPPDLTAGFSNLSINPKGPNASQNECIAHLKLLECLYRLRQTVSSNDGLFDIHDETIHSLNLTDEEAAPLLVKLAEKRWAIYVARAVDRFRAWQTEFAPSYGKMTVAELQSLGSGNQLVGSSYLKNKTATRLHQTKSNLPPIDVIMVWHTYLLNPRAFFEDCLRGGRMHFWHHLFPLELIANSIDSNTFIFKCNEDAKVACVGLTSNAWDNIDDAALAKKTIQCPKCNAATAVVWSEVLGFGALEGTLSDRVDEMLSGGRGYCDRGFTANCESCGVKISHDYLKVGKLCRDINEVRQRQSVPMPGSLLNRKGLPGSFGKDHDRTYSKTLRTITNLFMSEMGAEIHALRYRTSTMLDVKTVVEKYLKSRSFILKINSHTKLAPVEQNTFRRVMSRYWDNSSDFALDLVSAVTRQCSFTDKMHNIDWLHSPALINTIGRLRSKYERFLAVMAAQHGMAVPTLDIDLAWHTNQLNPYRYLQTTVATVKQFVDHDDKVSEVALNEAFATTAKTYQTMYQMPYSECTCWYCEAVRESSAKPGFFDSTLKDNIQRLHAVEQDPAKNVHISSHNAMRPEGDAGYDRTAALKQAQLEEAYARACNKARSKGRKVPRRRDYYYSDAYGYPVYLPGYCPFNGSLGYCPILYASAPACMAVAAGTGAGACGCTIGPGGCSTMAGSCAAGSCGATAGGGMVSGCGGGVSSCGASSGGGGGGGCGGGGGGGGCGGGGGGC